jgi:hypothetical protein
VALGGISRRKGVSSRTNLLISMKCLWVTFSPLITIPGQCPPNILLKEKRKEKTTSKKALNGLGNNGIHDEVQLALYRGTQR